MPKAKKFSCTYCGTPFTANPPSSRHRFASLGKPRGSPRAIKEKTYDCKNKNCLHRTLFHWNAGTTNASIRRLRLRRFNCIKCGFPLRVYPPDNEHPFASLEKPRNAADFVRVMTCDCKNPRCKHMTKLYWHSGRKSQRRLSDYEPSLFSR